MFREDHAPITSEEYARYRALMDRYARDPLPWSRRLRYLLGRLLCGRRPFAPWLDRERWQGRCVNRDVIRRSSATSSQAQQECRQSL